MIPNITPEDRERWNKAMARHQRRLKKKRLPLRIIAWAIGLIAVVGISATVYDAWLFRNYPSAVPVWDSTLENHSQIPENPEVDSLKTTSAGREYDSIVKRRDSNE
jgi:hypothetical protein